MSEQTISIDLALGDFSKLPREIRDMIWFILLPKSGSYSNHLCEYGENSLAILRTSKQIADEVLRHIYPLGKRPLLIELSSQYKLHDPWLVLSNNKGKNSLEWVCYSQYKVKRLRELAKIIPKFRINIEAPNSIKDIGQRVCLYQRVVRTANFFRSFTLSPKSIRIHLQNSTTREWFPDDDDEDQYAQTHFWAMLLPFMKLRNVKKSKITGSLATMITEWRQSQMRLATIYMTAEVSYGYFVDSERQWSDRRTRSWLRLYEKGLSLVKIHGLGWTCMMLRLHAYMCHYYFEQHLRYPVGFTEPMWRILQEGVPQSRRTSDTGFSSSWTAEKDDRITAIMEDDDDHVILGKVFVYEWWEPSAIRR